MSAAAGPLVVLGIGNVLLRDDGVGVHLVRELQRREALGDLVLPPDTRLVDGGTLGPGLLPLLAGTRALLLLDAAELGRAPGAVTALRGAALNGWTSPSRRCGVGDLLAAARLAGVLPTEVSLVGVQPGEIGAGLELTDDVRDAIPGAVAATLAALARLDAAAAPPSGSTNLEHHLTGSAA